MENFGIIVMFHAKPGMRDKIRLVWEKYVKCHAEESNELLCSMYNYGVKDPDLIVLFEVMENEKVLGKAFEESWFQDYLMELEPLLKEPPVNIPITNIWSKKSIG